MSSHARSLGPCWGSAAPEAGTASGEAPPGLNELAGEVGRRLAGELARAEELTRGWADRPLAAALTDAALGEALAGLAESGCWGRANQVAGNELWRVAGRWLEPGWLQHRARAKPRGYAGDYLLLARIWEGATADHPLGRLWDEYFLRQAAAQAVRARLEQTAHAIVVQCLEAPRPQLRVASIGSGPAVEIEQAARLLPDAARRALRVTLLDFDAEALEHAQARLATWMSRGAVALRRENLRRLGDGRTLAQLGPLDLLVCTGLLDYLADDDAAALLARGWEHLAPGGRLLVGNFAPHHPTRAYMEWIGAWYLVYRTPDDLKRLAARAGIPPQACRIGAERTGCDLFLSAGKP